MTSIIVSTTLVDNRDRAPAVGPVLEMKVGPIMILMVTGTNSKMSSSFSLCIARMTYIKKLLIHEKNAAIPKTGTRVVAVRYCSPKIK